MRSKNPTFILLRRELRGEVNLFIFSAGILAFATLLLTIVIALTSAFENSFVQSAKTLIGGDLSLRLSQRDFKPEELKWIDNNSQAISQMNAARVLAVHNERTHIVRLKGIDSSYPLYGTLAVQNTETPQTLQTPPIDGVYPAYINQRIGEYFDIAVGDTLKAGGVTLKIINHYLDEPDPDPRLWYGAPAIFVNKSLLETPHFTQPGALVARFTRAKLATNTDSTKWKDSIEKQFPDAGWRILGPEDAQQNVRRTMDRIRAFLSLASLASLLLAGIGCGSALSAFLRARLRAIAIFKLLGAPNKLILNVYLLISTLFTLLGAIIGASGGTVLLPIIIDFIAPYLPLPFYATNTVASFASAVFIVSTITIAFITPPLLAHINTNPLHLFSNTGNEHISIASRARDKLITVGALSLAIIVLPLPWQQKLYLGIIAIVALLFYFLAAMTIRFIESISAYFSPTIRLGTIAVCRHRRQTATTMMSLGIGIFTLISVIQAKENFSHQIDDTLDKEAPSVFFVGARSDQRSILESMVSDHNGELRVIPFIRGRIEAIGGMTTEEILAKDPEDKWILRGDRGVTWSDGNYIGSSKVSQGTLWDPNQNGLQASFDEEAAKNFGVKLGDNLELNFLGEPVTAVITSMRKIDWQSFDINFVVILSDVPIEGIPHTYMGGAYMPKDKINDLQLSIAKQLPNVIPVPTAPVFAFLKRLLEHITTLLLVSAGFLIISGLPMIIATLIGNHRRRIKTIATLRLIGVNKRTIIISGLVEFIIIAIVAVVPAMLLGTGAAWLLVLYIFELEWQMQWSALFSIASISFAFFIILGIIDITKVVNKPPYPLIRNE